MMFTFFISFCKFSTQEPSTGILTRLSSSSKLQFYACRHPDCNVVFTSIFFIRLDLYSTAEMNKQHKFGWVSGVMLVVAWLSTMYIIYGRVACTRRPQTCNLWMCLCDVQQGSDFNMLETLHEQVNWP